VTVETLLAWPVVGSLAGGIGAIGLGWALRRHRGRPGVNWFGAVFIAQATWCLAYGIGLLITDPATRMLAETVVWLGIIWTGVAFLGFALAYTGRGDVVRSRLFAAVIGFGVVSTLVLVSNPRHGGFWTGFRLDPVFGVATVSYDLGVWAFGVVAVETVLVASGVFLLVDTLLSYGPLYKRESAAVALSSLPPGLALVQWALGIGPVPQLQLAPLMFVPHVCFDAYAFRRASMFDRHPTTSRAAERTAIDDIDDPIVVTTRNGQVVRLNPAATTLIGVDAEAARDRPLNAFIDVTLGDTTDGETVALETDGRERTYTVSVSRLTDPNETHVGYTVVFSDVTARERRRQQLEVLNRVLRHNLRNDAGLVSGYGELLEAKLEDDELTQMADAIARRAGALAALGAKAGTVDSLLTAHEPVELTIHDTLNEVLNAAREDSPDAVIEWDTAESEATTIQARPDAVRAIVKNAVENALEHHDGNGTVRENGDAWVSVRLRREGDRLRLDIEDDGPGIPDHEIEPIVAGEETALEHGSGLGLWVIEWAAGTLGADVSYAAREPRGTRVTVRVPVG